MSDQKQSKMSIIRTIYMYLVCLVAVVTFIIGSISALNVTLKYFVFDLKTNTWEQSPEIACKEPWKYPSKATDDKGKFVEPLSDQELADCIAVTTAEQEEQGKRRALDTLSWALAAILISFPIWLYHWQFIKKN
jgi:hypothetical protein